MNINNNNNNNYEGIDLVPMLAFKPIDFDVESADELHSGCSALDQSFDSDGPGMSPMEIFRDGTDAEQGESLVRRANPIDEKQSSASSGEEELDVEMVDITSVSRVISPYPFSHTSKEEIEERAQLTNTFGWALPTETAAGADTKERFSIQVDYSRFFELGEAAEEMDECDDFSLSSQEANSLSEEDFLGSISEDFWEEGAGRVLPERSSSPTQISLGSTE